MYLFAWIAAIVNPITIFIGLGLYYLLFGDPDQTSGALAYLGLFVLAPLQWALVLLPVRWIVDGPGRCIRIVAGVAQVVTLAAILRIWILGYGPLAP